jgi:tetratricopeptide (TPR) repeat protein
MSTRPLLLVVTLAAAAGAGCGGPTKAGLEARRQARERLNALEANISNDQAMQAFTSGRFDKAASLVNTAIAQNPDWAPYRVLQGRVYLETHRLEKALESFTKAIELQPDLAEAHYYAGVVHQRWSDDAKAHEEYMSAFDCKPDDVTYLLAAAESLVAMEQFTEARQMVESRLTYFEHNAAMRELLGQVAMLENDPARAVVHFAEAQRLNPENSVIGDELIQAQYAAGLYGECYRAIRGILDGGADRPDLKRIEARCLVRMDRPESARNVYLQLTRDDPADVDLWIELGTVAWGLGDYQRLTSCGVRLVAIAPDRFEGYMFQGVSLRHNGDPAQAVAHLKKATDRAGTSAMPFLLLGRLLDQAGDAEGATAAYAAALRIDPDNADAQALYFDTQDRQLSAHPAAAGAGD